MTLNLWYLSSRVLVVEPVYSQKLCYYASNSMIILATVRPYLEAGKENISHLGPDLCDACLQSRIEFCS